MMNRLIGLGLVSVFAFGLVSCSKDKKTATTTAGQKPPAPVVEPGKPPVTPPKPGEYQPVLKDANRELVVEADNFYMLDRILQERNFKGTKYQMNVVKLTGKPGYFLQIASEGRRWINGKVYLNDPKTIVENLEITDSNELKKNGVLVGSYIWLSHKLLVTDLGYFRQEYLDNCDVSSVNETFGPNSINVRGDRERDALARIRKLEAERDAFRPDRSRLIEDIANLQNKLNSEFAEARAIYTKALKYKAMFPGNAEPLIDRLNKAWITFAEANNRVRFITKHDQLNEYRQEVRAAGKELDAVAKELNKVFIAGTFGG